MHRSREGLGPGNERSRQGQTGTQRVNTREGRQPAEEQREGPHGRKRGRVEGKERKEKKRWGVERNKTVGKGRETQRGWNRGKGSAEGKALAGKENTKAEGKKEDIKGN